MTSNSNETSPETVAAREADRQKTGEFGFKSQSDPEATLAGQAKTQRRETTRQLLNTQMKVEDAAIRARLTTARNAIQAELLAAHPNGHLATLHLDDTIWSVAWVRDAEGLVTKPQDHEALEEANRFLTSHFRDADSADLWTATPAEGTPTWHQEEAYLALTDEPEFTPTVAETIGFDQMSEADINTLDTTISNKLGRVSTIADRYEAEYRLTDGAEHYGLEGQLTKLETVLGGREKAIDAVIGSWAWEALNERLAEDATDRVTDAIREALEELQQG